MLSENLKEIFHNTCNVILEGHVWMTFSGVAEQCWALSESIVKVMAGALHINLLTQLLAA